MSTENSFPPIDQGSLGAKPLLESDDLERIIRKTDLQLVSGVTQEGILSCLNTIVDRTIRAQLTERLGKQTRERLKKHFESYKNLSRSLIHSEFPPPVPPADWVKQVEEWLKLSEKGLKERSSGGASNNVLQSYFYPRALGLFHVAFGVIPEATVSPNGSGERGAAFRFILLTAETVHERIQERGFSARVPDYLQPKVNWKAVTEDAIGKRIEAAKKLVFERSSHSGREGLDGASVHFETTSEQFAWIHHAELFRIQLLTV